MHEREGWKGRALRSEILPPPQDSDTDSGICADSDQSSPRHAQPINGFPGSSLPRHLAPGYQPPRELDNRDYLTPNSARRLLEGVNISASPRRLPQRPTGAPAAPAPPLQNGGPAARVAKQFRVRFADQVSDGLACTSSGSSDSNTSPKGAQNSCVTFYPQSGVGINQTAVPATVTQQNGFLSSPSRKFEATNGKLAQKSQPASERGYETLSRAPPPAMRKLQHNSYSIEDVEGLPEPPSYSIAMQRLRQLQQPWNPRPSSSSPLHGRPTLAQSTSVGPSPPIPHITQPSVSTYNSPVLGTKISAQLSQPRESIRDTVIRHSVENSLNNRFRNRSASLPRGTHLSDYEAYNDFLPSTAGRMYDLQSFNRFPPTEQMAGSLDNLHINTSFGGEMETDLAGRRRLPATPIGLIQQQMTTDAVELIDPIGRQPAYSRQRRCRRMGEMTGRRSASVGRYDDSPTLPFTDYDFVGGVEQAVRAQLVALDHRGFRTVLVEKIQPGPFGFYIATGMLNGQRGIFISRVSIASLSPVLSVGDEILYVDDELVKGRTLEYVQTMIAGKTQVVIVTLPSVGPALC
ncbi:unnamed protein product, partial [Mesorhabditis belari]|uniref:PDZ domain-containing protein n=1 Tax=Mesorhabditis belari TaxID=2138241 RepID=A0AAF3F3E6_9BILA